MAARKKKILLFYNFLSSFVQKDIAILQTEFAVAGCDFYTAAKWKIIFRFAAQKLFLLRHIFSADLIVCQFAGYHSVLPVLFGKIFGKRTLIIVGGTDAHYFPGIGYGNWQKKYLRAATAFSLKHCTHIAPKHSSLMQFDYTYDSCEPRAQGICERLPHLATPFTEIPNGYDAEKWQCTSAKKKNTFITVSSGWSFPFQKQLKGIDLILKAAPHFPECSFAVLGVPDKRIFHHLPDNVEVLPPCKNQDLAGVLSSYTFYLQLSMAEGFPNSLCEAMLCECIPIGSNVFSLPEIMGKSGFVLQERNVEALIALLRTALADTTPQRGAAARARIAENYTKEKRATLLLSLCRRLAG